MTASRSVPISLTLLWLIGVALRLAILAVPPVIPALRSEFNLTGTEIGALSGAPIVIFAGAALLGSRLVARIGVIAAVIAGLLLTALGSAGRGVAVGGTAGSARLWLFSSVEISARLCLLKSTHPQRLRGMRETIG